MARMSPVEGWMTTIELFVRAATAARAAVSACALIVVVRLGMLFGGAEPPRVFGGPRGGLRLRADRGGQARYVVRRDDDRLAVRHQLVPGGLDLDVQAGTALAGGRLALQQVGDRGQPGVAVGGEVVPAGIVDRGDLGCQIGRASGRE